MSTLTARTHLLAAIEKASSDGYQHFAAALAKLYHAQFGTEADKPEGVRQMHEDVLTECRLTVKKYRSPETFSDDDHALLMRVQERNKEREPEFIIIQ